MTTPEDTELKKELKKDFNQLLVKEFTADWKTQRLIMELNIDVMSLDNLINLITLNTQKAIEKDRTIRDPKVRLWTLNFVYSPTNPMFTQKNVEEYIADLPNPTEAGEK